jgi:hypothetical protein
MTCRDALKSERKGKNEEKENNYLFVDESVKELILDKCGICGI